MSIVHTGKGSLDELVFANRNKMYGAYALRKSYPNHLLRSVMIALCGLLLLFSPVLFQSAKTNSSGTTLSEQLVHTLQQTDLQIDIPVIEKPVSSGGTATSSGSNFRITRDRDVTTIQTISTTQTTGTQTGNTGISTGSSTGTGTTVVIPPEPERIPEFAEIMPEFSGGASMLYEYLTNNIVYPIHARDMGKEGKVIVTFVVDASGKIRNAEIVKSMGWGCDEEALRVIKEMPDWNPGMQNGKKVAVRVTIPITFKLD